MKKAYIIIGISKGGQFYHFGVCLSSQKAELYKKDRKRAHPTWYIWIVETLIIE